MNTYIVSFKFESENDEQATAFVSDLVADATKIQEGFSAGVVENLGVSFTKLEQQEDDVAGE